MKEKYLIFGSNSGADYFEMRTENFDEAEKLFNQKADQGYLDVSFMVENENEQIELKQIYNGYFVNHMISEEV